MGWGGEWMWVPEGWRGGGLTVLSELPAAGPLLVPGGCFCRVLASPTLAWQGWLPPVSAVAFPGIWSRCGSLGPGDGNQPVW